jgi:hypothetical protein
MIFTGLVAALVATGCDKGDAASKDAASKAKPNAPAKVDDPAIAAEPEPEPDEPGELVEALEPADSAAPIGTDAPADTVLAGPPSAGPGFTIGPAAKIDNDGSELAEIEVTEPLRNGKVTVRLAQHYETDGEDTSIWHLHARVEFEGVDAGAQLNHTRPSQVEFFERILVSSREIAKLDDGRWLVDVWLSGGAGEDSYSTDTAHSVLLIDPSKPSAAVIWTGLESSNTDGGGACVHDSHHEFAVVGDALVVSKVETTIADKAIMDELGWSAEECKATPKARAKVARIPLTKTP